MWSLIDMVKVHHCLLMIENQFEGIKIKCKIIYSLKPVSYTLICNYLRSKDNNFA